MTSTTAALILAAGEGKRMRSTLPKVLHCCAGLPLVAHAVKLALTCECDPVVVVVSPEGRRVREAIAARFPGAPLQFAVQQEPHGTGDAARVGLAAIAEHRGDVLVLCGDTPLLRPQTVQRLQAAAKPVDVALLSAEVPDPTGYGRVIRAGNGRDDRVSAIVEHRDATEEQRAIAEINAGVYLGAADLFRRTVVGLKRGNAQNELYLTDIVAMAAEGRGAVAVKVDDPEEVRGVNSRAELADAEAIFRRRLIAHHQEQGVTFLDPKGTFIGADVQLGLDVTVGVGVQIYGQTVIGDRVQIEGPTLIRDCRIESEASIHGFSHLQGATVGKAASVGPFARLRIDARLDEGARVGNFVEMKKAHLGEGAKANHLAYLGDAEIGARSNVGAGTITCNYDGQNKHPTVLGEGVFIGSNSTLVAPVELGSGSYVAAGSTITQQVPADALAFGRARQANREGYAVKLRDRLKAGSAKGKGE